MMSLEQNEGFDDRLQEYFWSYDNRGLKNLLCFFQFFFDRFQSVLGDHHVIKEKAPGGAFSFLVSIYNFCGFFTFQNFYRPFLSWRRRGFYRRFGGD